jgi:hypothetical protein
LVAVVVLLSVAIVESFIQARPSAVVNGPATRRKSLAVYCMDNTRWVQAARGGENSLTICINASLTLCALHAANCAKHLG